MSSLSGPKTARVDCIVGARPNFMKVAPIVAQLRLRPCFSARLIHTGQHYSPEMSDSFFRDLRLPPPDINLNVGGGSRISQTAQILAKLEEVFTADRPDLVLVVGDVTSTVAAAVGATQMGIPVAHVEAGLRSFDRGMPEEINRVVTDAVSDYLFASEPSGVRNLQAEGASPHRIHFVGNVMIDSLLASRERAMSSAILECMQLQRRQYALVTLHRPSNVDDADRLERLWRMLVELAETIPVVFPVHPRTRQRVNELGLPSGRIVATDPLGYLDFMRLMMDARMVLTDSGGIQEETTILDVPCLTLRENTERPITIEQGTNQLVGVDPEVVLRAALETLEREPAAHHTPELWDGRASERIVDILERCIT
jgi:UDP-N-acetylglucosamine 2-epimerase (non-hydrolysing)